MPVDKFFKGISSKNVNFNKDFIVFKNSQTSSLDFGFWLVLSFLLLLDMACRKIFRMHLKLLNLLLLRKMQTLYCPNCSFYRWVNLERAAASLPFGRISVKSKVGLTILSIF